MIRRILRSSFSLLGYKVVNKKYKDIFTMRQSMVDAFEQLKKVGFYPDLVIDVGAADGTPELQECFTNSNFFWVEPLTEFQSGLEKLKQELKGDYLIAALGDEEGEMEINVRDDKVGSTFLNNAEEFVAGGESRKIEVMTLQKVAIEKNFNHHKRILLKVDVQGYELNVLDGAGAFLNDIDVVVLEVSFYKFFEDGPDFYDVVTYMKNKGFVVYDIVGGINRPIDMALAQKDLVFVKEKGLIRNTHRWD